MLFKFCRIAPDKPTASPSSPPTIPPNLDDTLPLNIIDVGFSFLVISPASIAPTNKSSTSLVVLACLIFLCNTASAPLLPLLPSNLFIVP